MDTTTPGTRPTFLTVLCILSFLMGAWGLWNGIEGAFTDQPQRDLEEAPYRDGDGHGRVGRPGR
jgi:hypothetical protein